MAVTLSGVDALCAAIGHARQVALAAYLLPPGPVREALETAARRGAHVEVRLEGRPFDRPGGGLRRENAATVAELRRAGVDAALTRPDEPFFHLKAAVVDGVTWLDDRNWVAGDRATIVRDDDPEDASAAQSAIADRPGASRDLVTTKRDAELREQAVIAAAGSAPVAVESETVGYGPVATALFARARAGLPTRLLVARREAAGHHGGRERALLRRLAAAGVEVRVGAGHGPELDQKLAVSAASAWVGSANASSTYGPYGDQRDWGLVTRSPELTAALRERFERNWATAAPV